MGDTTSRLGLPLLAAGQAQKELFHNEALVALDALVQPAAQTLGDPAPPAGPVIGQSWIVGAAPTGDWAGAAGALASWTEGGWRFAPPMEGMWVWVAAAELWACYRGAEWLLGSLTAASLSVNGVQVVGPRQPAVPAPQGGAQIDAEGRAAIGAILAALRLHGLIAE